MTIWLISTILLVQFNSSDKYLKIYTEDFNTPTRAETQPVIFIKLLKIALDYIVIISVQYATLVKADFSFQSS